MNTHEVCVNTETVEPIRENSRGIVRSNINWKEHTAKILSVESVKRIIAECKSETKRIDKKIGKRLSKMVREDSQEFCTLCGRSPIDKKVNDLLIDKRSIAETLARYEKVLSCYEMLLDVFGDEHMRSFGLVEKDIDLL